MKNRISNKPGHIKFTLDDGTVLYGTIEMDDEPQEEGTPLNKATLLTDETAEAIGVTNDNPTVNDALSALHETDNTVYELANSKSTTNNPIKITFSADGWIQNSTTGYYEQSVTCSGLLTTDDTRTRVEPVGNTDAEAQALTDEAYSMIDYVACTTAGKLYARCPDGAPTVAFSVYVIITR